MQKIILIATIFIIKANCNEQFVLTPVEHGDELPENAIEVQPLKPFEQEHVANKKIIAVPINEVHPDTHILTNDQGHAVVVKPTENSSEDLATAESIVFRPLFAYRKKLEQRRRVYVPAERRVQQPVRRQQDVRVVYYPVYQNNYPGYYYPRRYGDAQFPTLA